MRGASNGCPTIVGGAPEVNDVATERQPAWAGAGSVDGPGPAGVDDLLERRAELRDAAGEPEAVVHEWQAVHAPSWSSRTCACLRPSATRDGAVREIRAATPAIAIVVLSHHLQMRYAVELLSTDAHGVGYLLKQRMADVAGFLAALDEIGAGGTVIDAEVVAVMIGRLRAEALDAHQLSLLGLVAQGRTDVAIAAELALGEEEVRRRLASAFALLGLPTVPAGHERVSALVRRATRNHKGRLPPRM